MEGVGWTLMAVGICGLLFGEGKTAAILSVILLLAGAGVKMIVWSAEAQTPVVGTITYVHDGDTLRIGRQRIRIWGIDSPELNTSAGKAARDWALRWEGKHAICTPLGKSYHRIVARCSINGKDIGRQILESGHACEWKKYSKGYYGMKETCESRGQR